MTATRIESAVMDSPWSPEARAALGRLPFHERATTEQQIAEICAGKCAKLVVDGKLVGFLGYEIQGNAFFITALVALSENTALVATCREAIEAGRWAELRTGYLARRAGAAYDERFDPASP